MSLHLDWLMFFGMALFAASALWVVNGLFPK
jgi:hypothetical protein